MKAKRVEAASSGVVARRNRAIGAKKKRRRSQVERLLALKKADELLEQSGKAEDFRQRRGSLGMMRPEDASNFTLCCGLLPGCTTPSSSINGDTRGLPSTFISSTVVFNVLTIAETKQDANKGSNYDH